MASLVVPTEKIAATLGFTLEELELNRAGRVSPHQSWDAIQQALTMGGLAVVAAGVMLCLVFIVRPTGWARLYYVLGFGSLALVSVFGWRAIVGAVERTVLVAEGPLNLHGTGRGTAAAIGRASVPVRYQAAFVLTTGATYRLYYLARADKFLSIEPVAGAGATPGGAEAGQ